MADLNSLASDAATIEKDGGGFMKPGEKRKRGRPKKDPNAAQAPGGTPSAQAAVGGPSVAPIDPITELLPLTRTVTTLYTNCLVMYAEDERARPDDQTQDVMSKASAGCLVQYFPDTFGKHAALILLATIVGSTGFNAWILRRENLAKLMAQKESMNGIHEKGVDRGPVMGSEFSPKI